jgi:hypothetical protein
MPTVTATRYREARDFGEGLLLHSGSSATMKRLCAHSQCPNPPTALHDAHMLAAYVIFGASYLVFAMGKFPGLKIDRPAAAIIGAVGMRGT